MLKKEDLVLTDAESRKVDVFERAIDTKLHAEWTGEEGGMVKVKLGNNPISGRAKHELQRRYQNGGWKLNIYYSDRDRILWVEIS